MKKIFLSLLLCTTILAQTKSEDVQSFSLANGMKIMVVEDHSIPNANLYFFFKVGSRNEYPGITGLSHFFEHMMFNGAKKYGFKMFDRTMEAHGGSNNAYTTENITVYTDWFPSSSMETMFDLEADRIQYLSFIDSVVESERGVILSERSTGLENSNWRALEEQVKGAAFIAHPYHWSVIGYESDIKGWKKEDLQRYFQTYYAPNNCVAVVVGDVTLKQVKELAQKYFEPIPAQQPPRPVHTVEPEQIGEKRVFVKKEVTTPNIMIVYHVPASRSNEYYALDLLNSILTSGRSSRLYKALIDEKQLATDILSDLPLSVDPNLIYFFAELNKDVSTDQVEAEIYAQINKIITEGVTEKELQKVKNQKLVEFYQGIQTINGKANNLGSYEIYFGDYRKLFSAASDYQKVTAADIQNVAKKYLKKSNRTVGILTPHVD